MAQPKTFKREVATLQLVFHWALVMAIVYVAIRHPDREITPLVELAIGLAIWVYGFAAAAFGMDSWAKQLMSHRRNGKEDTLGD